MSATGMYNYNIGEKISSEGVSRYFQALTVFLPRETGSETERQGKPSTGGNAVTQQNVQTVKERFRLSGNALKVIAIIAMTIDHIAWMGIEEYSQAGSAIADFPALHRASDRADHVLLCGGRLSPYA